MLSYDAIQVKYIPSTNTKGSKLKAFTCHDGPKGGITHSWDYMFRDGGVEELVKFYCAEKGWPFDEYVGGLLPNGDHVFVRAPQQVRIAA